MNKDETELQSAIDGAIEAIEETERTIRRQRMYSGANSGLYITAFFIPFLLFMGFALLENIGLITMPGSQLFSIQKQGHQSLKDSAQKLADAEKKLPTEREISQMDAKELVESQKKLISTLQEVLGQIEKKVAEEIAAKEEVKSTNAWFVWVFPAIAAWGVLMGLYFSWRRDSRERENLEHAREQLQKARRRIILPHEVSGT